MHLEELLLPLSKVRGIGPASQKTLHAMGIRSVRDLFWHLPREYQDRSRQIPLAQARLTGSLFAGDAAEAPGVWINTVAQVTGHDFFGAPPRQTLKVRIEDDSAPAVLVCFGRNFLANQLKPGTRLALFGRAQFRFKEIQLAVFEFAVLAPDAPIPESFNRPLGLYPLGGDLTQGFFRKTINAALQAYGRNIDEFLPPALGSRQVWPDRAQALRNIHEPASMPELTSAHDRLVYEELLLLQLQVAGRALERRRVALANSVPGLEPNSGDKAGPWPQKLQDLAGSLPFDLTPGQVSSISEILADLCRPWPLQRLIQGDVGSGKTLVALMAALAIIAGGGQVALMVPTVLLARQHAEKAAALLEPLGIRVALLAGLLSTAARRPLLAALAAGEIDLVIGTHALFSPHVIYKSLDLAIIDEQHRFGVLQRQALHQKARRPNLLMMSATPIPQTLVLTVFGDLDVSVIADLPAHRKPIETHLARMGNEQKVYDWVNKELSAGHQAYFVYPLIDESGEGAESGEKNLPGESGELKNAETMYRHLATKVFPGRKLGMIHSRLEEEAKESVMRQFNAGELDILVATSVVEVGVDVANATCMVIEHAERFGLAALHQLRGRVGRGKDQSYCFLVYQEPLSEIGKRRLKAIKDSNDGFQISEDDLAIRGPGDIKGTAQSGFLRLHIADLARDMAVMNQARADAFALLEADPGLQSPDNQGLRRVLDLMLQEELRHEMAGASEAQEQS